MLVQLRVRRACVWLSSTAVARQDGFLALVKTTGKTPMAHVVYGALEDPNLQPTDTIKRWTSVPIKYSDLSTGRKPMELDSEGTSAIEIVLFAVIGTDSRKQKLNYVANTILELSDQDLIAVDNAQDVVFASPLNVDLGNVEIALQRADVVRPVDETIGFSVQWTSSAALERDLAEKERIQFETEMKLIERLDVVATKAQRAVILRAQALAFVQQRHAAWIIQCAYRALRHRRREQRRALRREREAIERQKKEAVRAKVIDRNQQRTQRLLAQWTRKDPVKSVDIEPPSRELADWIRRQQEATCTKLRATLAHTQAERDVKLRALRCDDRRMRHVTDKSPTNGLSDELIHAIQQVHLRK